MISDSHSLLAAFQEFEVDKTLGIKGPADILAMGIGKYNDECRSIVMRYAKVSSCIHILHCVLSGMGRVRATDGSLDRLQE